MDDEPSQTRAATEGRSDGWDVLIDGRPVAFLDRPHFEEMFWFSWRITPVTDDIELAGRLLSEQFWTENYSRWNFRSRSSGRVAKHAFPASRFVAPGRVLLRRIYPEAADPTIQECETTRVEGVVARGWARLLAMFRGRC